MALTLGPIGPEEADDILAMLRIELSHWDHLINTWGDMDGLRAEIEAYEYLAGQPDPGL